MPGRAPRGSGCPTCDGEGCLPTQSGSCCWRSSFLCWGGAPPAMSSMSEGQRSLAHLLGAAAWARIAGGRQQASPRGFSDVAGPHLGRPVSNGAPPWNHPNGLDRPTRCLPLSSRSRPARHEGQGGATTGQPGQDAPSHCLPLAKGGWGLGWTYQARTRTRGVDPSSLSAACCPLQTRPLQGAGGVWRVDRAYIHMHVCVLWGQGRPIGHTAGHRPRR